MSGVDPRDTISWMIFFPPAVEELCQIFGPSRLSNGVMDEKNPGCLGYIGDSTTQIYGGYNEPLQGSL